MSAELNDPKSVVLEAGSTAAYFVADMGNSRIRVVRNGIISTLASGLTDIFGLTFQAGSIYATIYASNGQVRVARHSPLAGTVWRWA